MRFQFLQREFILYFLHAYGGGGTIIVHGFFQRNICKERSFYGGKSCCSS
uniref:Uncharacterized protein n=1 Tax=Rhizophora mucronata TaxID=61149 RepID=A0A2P2ISX7_RHIMU